MAWRSRGLGGWIVLCLWATGCSHSSMDEGLPAAAALSLVTDEAPAEKRGQTEGPWGDLTGRFVYDGDPPKPPEIETLGKDGLPEKIPGEWLVIDPETRGVANVVIYVRTKEVKIHPDLATPAKKRLEFVARDARFVPHILLARVGQEIVFSNADPIAHNFNYQPAGEEGFGPLIKAVPDPVKLTRADLIPRPVGCNIHPWMMAYILVRPNPYAALSGKDGTFRIPRLPAGELEFQVWHELPGYVQGKPAWERGRFTFTIAPGAANDLGEIKLAPALLERRGR